MESPNLEEKKFKIDPDGPSDGRHAVFVQENAEVKEENEQKLICCTVCNAFLVGSLALFEHLEEHTKTMFDDQRGDGAIAANDGGAGCDLVSLSSESEIEREPIPKVVSKEIHDLQETPEVATGFICDRCSKIFKRKVTLIRHFFNAHHPKKFLYLSREEIDTLVCFYCKERKYPDIGTLRSHILQVHYVYLRQIRNPKPKEKFYTCDICSEEHTTKQKMIEHFQRNHSLKIPNIQSRKYSCKFCNLNFRSITELVQHRKSKDHLEQIKAKDDISCPICVKTFVSREKLNEHKDKWHSFVQCDYCGSKLNSINDLHLHILNHACLKRDEKTRHNSWDCNACEKRFSNKEEFFAHHKSAHPYSRSFRCPECFRNLGVGKKSHWGSFQSHLAAHKRGYNGFYCSECRKFTQHYKGHQVWHQVRHIRPHSCDQCAKRFSMKAGLDEHRRLVHLKNEQYVCEVCGKISLSQNVNQQHFSKYHSNNEFTCDICGIKRKMRNTFRIHMATHLQVLPFSCGTCRKGFRARTLLRRHELTHSGIKPFSCSVCSRDFNQIDSLKRHMRQHTGEGPYKCKDCGKGFKQTASLKAHIHIHHNEDRKRCEICEKSFRNDVALRKHLKDHVRQENKKKKPERNSKRSGKGKTKKRNTRAKPIRSHTKSKK